MLEGSQKINFRPSTLSPRNDNVKEIQGLRIKCPKQQIHVGAIHELRLQNVDFA